jgi:hypothetical protein
LAILILFYDISIFRFVSSRSPDVIIHSKLANREESKVSTAGNGVRSFAVNSTGDYMGILDEGRGLSIVRLQNETGVLGKKYYGSNQEHKSNNLVHADTARKYEKFGFGLSWHPNDLCLAVPGDKQSISLFVKAAGTGSHWEEEPLVFANLGNSLQHTDVINLVRFSPNGRYLASADISGTVLVWDMVEKNPISKLSFTDRGAPAPLYDLQWGSAENDNYLMAVSATSCGKASDVVSTSDGRLGPVEPVPVPVAPAPAPVHSPAKAAAKAPMASPIAPYKSPKKVVLSPPPVSAAPVGTHSRLKKLGGGKMEKQADHKNDDDDDNLFVSDAAGDDSIEAIKQQSMKASMNDEDDDHVSNAYLEDSADGFVENQGHYPYAGQGGHVDSDVVSAYLHQPVEPSSTLFDAKGRRYMVWNLVGSIVCREEDSGNRMEIKFADISGTNKNSNFPDTDDYKLAALSYEGALFANQPEDPEIDDLTGLPIGDTTNTSDKKGSEIRYHAFPGQSQLNGANESFSMTLPVGEIVDCLAVGKGWAAVATSKNLLRIFSSTGLQLSLSWLRGPVVCTVGFMSQLAVFYNDGSSLPDGSPNLAVELFSIVPTGVRQEAHTKAPVTPGGSLLQWAGFSEDGILFSMDTSGVLSAMMRLSGGWQWIPMLDTVKASKKIDHKFWPICVKASNLCYVLLNGESKPLVYPPPVVSTKAMSPPIVEMFDASNGRDRDRVESENARNRNLLLEQCLLSHLEGQAYATADLDELADVETAVSRRKTEMDKALLQLFHNACQLQRNALSSDTALRLRTIAAVNAAIQIAQHFERPGLVRLLENVLRQKQDDEYADMQMAAPAPLPVKRAPAAPPATRPPGGRPSAQVVTPDAPPQAAAKADTPPPRDYYCGEQTTPEVEYTGGSAHENADSTLDTAIPLSRLSSFTKKKNLMSTQAAKPLAPPVNRFASFSNVSSPSKKRSFPHEDLRHLKSSSPSPKKPALLSVSLVF